MRSRRGATALAGVLGIDKPRGMTSHDVVSALRAATGERRIGHAGTLDPMATGLLLVLVGRAARLEQYLVGHDKRYEARIVFGTATDTLDAEGTATEERPVPGAMTDPGYAEELLARFTGELQQVPPAFSAIKQGGVAAHRRARAGEDVVIPARAITVHQASLQAVTADPVAWEVSFAVSKGTYIRTLADDIGRAAGTVAHLGALRRCAVGSLGIERAVTLDAALEAARAGTLPSLMLDPVPLLGYPLLVIDAASVKDGKVLAIHDHLAALPADAIRVLLADDASLLGIYRKEGELLVPETVFAPGIAR